MKRDMELVREILVKVEELPFDGRSYGISVDGHSDTEVVYHIMLLHEAGLIEAQDLTTLGEVNWQPKRLTYVGHEFLDAARSNKVWDAAKSWLLRTTGALTIEGMELALQEVTKRLLT